MSACSLLPPSTERLRARQMEAAVLPMADAALDAGQFESAKRLYQRLLDVDPDSVPARMGLGDVALRQRRITTATGLYLSAVALAEGPEERQAALLAHARTALTGGYFEAAKDSFTQLTDPEEDAPQATVAWAYNGIGLALLLEGDVQGAVVAMERAVSLAREEARFQSNLSRALAMRGDLPERDSAAANWATGAEAHTLGLGETAQPPPSPTQRAEPQPAPSQPTYETPPSPPTEEPSAEAEAPEPASPEPRGQLSEDGAPAAADEADAAQYRLEEPPAFAGADADARYENANEAAAEPEPIHPDPSNPVHQPLADGTPAFPNETEAALPPPEEQPLISDMERQGYQIANPPLPPRQDDGPPRSRPTLWLTGFPVDVDGERYVQASAFSDPTAAEDLAVELRTLTERPVVVSQIEGADGPMHRVRIGPLHPNDPLLDRIKPAY